MQLKMKTGLSGPDYCLAPDDSRTFDDAEGQRLIDAGFAVLDDSEAVGETPTPATSTRSRRQA